MSRTVTQQHRLVGLTVGWPVVYRSDGATMLRWGVVHAVDCDDDVTVLRVQDLHSGDWCVVEERDPVMVVRR